MLGHVDIVKTVAWVAVSEPAAAELVAATGGKEWLFTRACTDCHDRSKLMYDMCLLSLPLSIDE